MNIDASLSKTFEVTPIGKTKVVTSGNNIIKTLDKKIEDDYEITRSHIRMLLVQGQEALNGALEVAKQSEHPRAFEVVGNLIKQLADVNQQLMDLHQQKVKLDNPKDSDKKDVTNNNAIFVGSTADLNKLIKNMTKGE